MKKNKPTVTIIILTCNSYSLVRNCLKAVSKLTTNYYIKKVIVVDNGSKDNVVGKLNKQFPEVIFIKNNINYGFSKGINVGIRLSLDLSSDYVFLLNDDTLFKRDFLDTLVKAALDNQYPISGPQIITPDNYIWSRGGNIDANRFSGTLIDYGKKNTCSLVGPHQVDFISGTAMLVNSKVFNTVGLLNENYFLYYDDVDFCYCAKKQGLLSYIVPESSITHLESMTIGKNSPSHYYYAAKSRLIFLFTKAPFTIRLREILRLPLSLLELLIDKNVRKRKYEIKAYIDFLLVPFGQRGGVI